MKKNFLILIPILIITLVIACIFIIILNKNNSLTKETMKIGKLNNETNIEFFNNIITNKTTHNISKDTNKNEEKKTNTVSNNKVNMENENKTITNKEKINSKSNNDNKKSSNNANKKTITTDKKATTTPNKNENQTNTNSNKVNNIENNVNETSTNSLSVKSTNNNTKKEEIHKHIFSVNAGWFNTNEEAEAKVDEIFNKWNTKYNNGEITWEELGKNCPIGYEIFRCSCGKSGLHFTYE